MNTNQQNLAKILEYFKKGSKLSKPEHNVYISYDNGKCTACAVGTIIIGMGNMPEETWIYNHKDGFDNGPSWLNYYDQIDSLVPNMRFYCIKPDCHSFGYKTDTVEPQSLACILDHMFESHLLTRIQIARYIEKQIKILEQAPVVFVEA